MSTASGVNSSLIQSLNKGADTTAETTKKKGEVGKDEFLQLLVTQLKNQDPLEPMKNEEFAVNLAQFSQLEQLVSINSKVGADSGQELSTLASYLGKEVTLSDDTIQYTNGDGGIVKFDLAQDASSVQIELLNEDGSVKDTIDLGEMAKGKQAVALSAEASENGAYAFRVVANANGTQFKPKGSVAGLVSGFVPGPEPTLLVSGREITPNQIVEVNLPAM